MKIAEMVSEGITQNVNLPSRAMERALAPVAPGGRALEPLRRPAAAPGSNGSPVAVSAPVRGAGAVSVTQIFTGPTTSGGRVAEVNWKVRYATQARRGPIERPEEPRVGKAWDGKGRIGGAT